MLLTRHDNLPAANAALAILACLLWSTAFAGIKIGLRHTDPFCFAGVRFMLAGLLLVPFWWRQNRNMAGMIRENLKLILMVSFFQTFLLYGLFYFGITLVSGAVTAIIVGASPLVAALLAHYCMGNDALTPAKVASLSLGIAGVVVLCLSREPWTSPAGLKEFGGIILLLLSTVASAYGNILVARDKKWMEPVMLNSLQIFLGGLLLFLLSVPLEGLPRRILPLEYYAVLLWLAALSAIAFSLWFVLLRRPGIRVSEVNIWKFIIPVFGAALSWLLLPEESPTTSAVTGMACIALSIILFNLAVLRQERRAAGKNVPVRTG
ncbi:MAG: DMT family transporter [Desulfobulbaceae bacterium]